MADLGHEEYGFAANAGYPSPVHQDALRRLGPTPHHRLSWSYLDDLPQWRHLGSHRPDIEGQLSLIYGGPMMRYSQPLWRAACTASMRLREAVLPIAADR